MKQVLLLCITDLIRSTEGEQ